MNSQRRAVINHRAEITKAAKAASSQNGLFLGRFSALRSISPMIYHRAELTR